MPDSMPVGATRLDEVPSAHRADVGDGRGISTLGSHLGAPGPSIAFVGALGAAASCLAPPGRPWQRRTPMPRKPRLLLSSFLHPPLGVGVEGVAHRSRRFAVLRATARGGRSWRSSAHPPDQSSGAAWALQGTHGIPPGWWAPTCLRPSARPLRKSSVFGVGAVVERRWRSHCASAFRAPGSRPSPPGAIQARSGAFAHVVVGLDEPRS